MKKRIAFSLLSLLVLTGCSIKKSNSSSSSSSPTVSSSPLNVDEVVLPDVFKNTNYCNVAIEYYSGGVALILNEKNEPDIQNISFEVDFYSIQFERLPMTKKDNMYFLPFRVTNQIIDDGYLKNGTEYKFWLSYENSTYFCGISLNDYTLTEPTATLMEGLM